MLHYFFKLFCFQRRQLPEQIWDIIGQLFATFATPQSFMFEIFWNMVKYSFAKAREDRGDRFLRTLINVSYYTILILQAYSVESSGGVEECWRFRCVSSDALTVRGSVMFLGSSYSLFPAGFQPSPGSPRHARFAVRAWCLASSVNTASKNC